MSDFTETEKRFAELVLGNLDDQGFLDLKGVERPDGTRTPDMTIEELAEEAGVNPEDAPEILRIMQEWDPVGVCSRDLRECLLVQAEVFGSEDLDITIIDKHLHNLEKHNYQAIARDLKVPVEEVYESVKEIQKLESRPARNFSETDEKQIAITPDVYVVRDEEKWTVTDNDRGVQRLYINETLTKQLANTEYKTNIANRGLLKLLAEGTQAPLAGRVGLERPADERRALRINLDGTELPTALFAAHVQVADRCLADGAALSDLLQRLGAYLLAEVGRVPLCDDGHEPVRQLA
jgi:NTP pyrophosphatase (non-canonical NTP hydrolase)